MHQPVRRRDALQSESDARMRRTRHPARGKRQHTMRHQRSGARTGCLRRPCGSQGVGCRPSMERANACERPREAAKGHDAPTLGRDRADAAQRNWRLPRPGRSSPAARGRRTGMEACRRREEGAKAPPCRAHPRSAGRSCACSIVVRSIAALFAGAQVHESHRQPFIVVEQL